MLLGAHVPPESPLAEAAARDAECIQIFLSPPQGWAKPVVREDEDALRAATIPVYVHAPYIINVATGNNRVRHPSRQNLAQTVEAAARIDAAGVIVHGGHVESEADLDAGFDRWRKTLEQLESPIPILIENTAGGTHAMSRYIDVIGRLWDHLAGIPVGFCLDTCHLHAAGEEMVTAVERVRSLVGRIDLVHCNDSKDTAGSGRDRHQNLGRKDRPVADRRGRSRRGCARHLRDAGRRDGAQVRHRMAARAPRLNAGPTSLRRAG